MKTTFDQAFLSPPQKGSHSSKSIRPEKGSDRGRHSLKCLFDLAFLSSPRKGRIGSHTYRPLVPLPIGEGAGRGRVGRRGLMT